MVHSIHTADEGAHSDTAAMQMTEIVLASGSAVRRRLLEAAGLRIVVQPADLDEGAILERLQSQGEGGGPAEAALALARAKALERSRSGNASPTIAADQILVFNDKILQKARSIDEAHERLRSMRGATHYLAGACVVAIEGEVRWSRVDRIGVALRNFSDSAFDVYLKIAGAAVLRSVSCYEIEGLGAQLIERIEGDYFSALGLPLLPLLEELRTCGALVR